MFMPTVLGAELFAKRRKKAEKWVVDAYQTPAAAPGPGPTMVAFSDAGVQRVQQNMKMDQIQEKYQHPRVKMVQSPWDAALESGSADNAFVSYDQQHNQQQQVYSASAGQVQQFDYGSSTSSSLYSSTKKDVQVRITNDTFQNEIHWESFNLQYQSSKQIKEQLSARDLAYRPNVPQGWNRPPVVLPAGKIF